MEILYGALGMILVLGVFAVGLYLGWRARERYAEKQSRVEEEQLGADERLRLIEEQQAFRTMLNYNPDMAYGVDKAQIFGDGG